MTSFLKECVQAKNTTYFGTGGEFPGERLAQLRGLTKQLALSISELKPHQNISCNTGRNRDPDFPDRFFNFPRAPARTREDFYCTEGI